MAKMQSKSVGSLISGFKSSVTKKINISRNEQSFDNVNRMAYEGSVWQRNYWEHIIRNENEYFRITAYIRKNPLKWYNDKLNGGKGNIVMESYSSYGEEIWMV